MSVFTEILKDLGRHSENVDAGTATGEDFIEFQDMVESRILNAHLNGYLTGREYKALNAIAAEVHAGFRIVLHLDR
jgi:hypothetical protein